MLIFSTCATSFCGLNSIRDAFYNVYRKGGKYRFTRLFFTPIILSSDTGLRLLQYELASADCTRALELEPNNFTAFYRRGLAEKELGHLTAAKNDFSDAVLILPTDRAAAHELALLTQQLQSVHSASALSTPPAHTALPVSSAATFHSSAHHQHAHGASLAATATAAAAASPTAASRFAAAGRSSRLGIIGNASASNGQPHLFEPLSLQFSGALLIRFGLIIVHATL